MKTRPNTPRTGRPKKLRVKKSAKKKMLGKRNPKLLSAALGRRRKRRR